MSEVDARESADPSDRIRAWLRASQMPEGQRPKNIPPLDADWTVRYDWFRIYREGLSKRDIGIRNGVKTGQETVSMQIRVLKSQNDLLKVASFQEKRPASAIIREVLAEYFARKCSDPDPKKRDEWVNLLLNVWEWEE